MSNMEAIGMGGVLAVGGALAVGGCVAVTALGCKVTKVLSEKSRELTKYAALANVVGGLESEGKVRVAQIAFSAMSFLTGSLCATVTGKIVSSAAVGIGVSASTAVSFGLFAALLSGVIIYNSQKADFVPEIV